MHVESIISYNDRTPDGNASRVTDNKERALHACMGVGLASSLHALMMSFSTMLKGMHALHIHVMKVVIIVLTFML